MVGVGTGVGVAVGTPSVGVGAGVVVVPGVAVVLGLGLGVGEGHPEALPRALSLCEQSLSAPDTGLNALGRVRPLTNGTAIAAPVAVPYTWFIPCSAELVPLVCPTQVATTQSGV